LATGVGRREAGGWFGGVGRINYAEEKLGLRKRGGILVLKGVSKDCRGARGESF